MNRWLVGGGSASASAAAAAGGSKAEEDQDPEKMTEEELRIFLRSKRVVVGDKAPMSVLRRHLGKWQYRQLATLCRPDERDHNPVEQNTPEWYFMRRGPDKMRVGGSEIGVITGRSRFSLPFSLWQKIVQQQDGDWPKDEETPPACVHGHTCEPLIADVFCKEMGYKMLPGGYYRHPNPKLGLFYGASPDGRLLSNDIKEDGAPVGEVCALLEIKAPYATMYTDIKDEHMAQMQYQMWVSGIPVCYYLAVWLRKDAADAQGTGYGPRSTPPGETRVFLCKVHYSMDYLAWMIPRLFLFTKYLARRIEPPRDLYQSEATGYEAPPQPRVERIDVPTGSWRVEKNPRPAKKSATSKLAKFANRTGPGPGAGAGAKRSAESAGMPDEPQVEEDGP